jgi:hypothetical protein
MAVTQKVVRSKRPMPKLTEEVMAVFLNRPDGSFIKSQIVNELRSDGLTAHHKAITPALQWLFDYRYIKEAPGTGHQRYYLNKKHPKWPPVNVRD